MKIKIGSQKEDALKNGDEIKMYFFMKMENNIDYDVTTSTGITVEIPKIFEVTSGTTDIEVKREGEEDKPGIKIGTCVINKEKSTAFINFNSKICDLDDVTAEVEFGAKINVTESDGKKGQITKTFKIEEYQKSVTIYFKGQEDTPEPDVTIPAISKTCKNFDMKTGEIKWEINIRGNNQTLNNVKVVDYFKSEEMKFVSATIDGEDFQMDERQEGELTNLAGTIPVLKPDEEKKIIVSTVIDNKILKGKADGSKYKFVNKAKLTDEIGKNLTPEVEASTQVTIDWVDKKGSEKEKKDVKYIEWSVTVNKHHGNIQGSTITDKLPKGLKLDKDSVVLKEYGTNEEIKLTDTTPGYSFKAITESDVRKYQGKDVKVDYTHQIEYTFPDEEDHAAYQLCYGTEVVDEEGLEGAFQKIDFYNYAQLGGIQGIDDIYHDFIGVSIGGSFIEKRQFYTLKSRNITWKILVNKDKYDIDEGACVIDELDIDDSRKDNRLEFQTMKIFKGDDFTEVTLTKDEIESDNEVKKQVTLPDGVRAEITITKKGFTMKFIDPIKDTYEIQYITLIKDEYFLVNSTNIYKNKVKLEAMRRSKKIDVDAMAQSVVNSVMLKKEAIGYDYKNQVANWRVIINGNKVTMKDAVITEIIPEGQEYVDEPIVVEKVTQIPNGDKKYEGHVVTDVTATAEKPDENGRVKIKLSELSDTYAINIKTRLTNEKAKEIFAKSGAYTLKNEANLMCTGMRPGGINDDAEQKVESIMIDKKGEQLNQGDPIRWTITVNKNRLTLQNVVVKDELIGDLDLWEGELSDVRIYETDVNEKGELTPVGEAIDWQNNSDKYNVTFDAEHNTLRVAFLGTITKCYQIVFKTEAIKYDVIQEFGNKVSVEGQGIENGETEASHKVKARYIKACATGRRVRGSVKVVKKNQEGQPLKGAKFALIDWRGTKVLEKETDENGKPLKGAVFALLDESGKLIAEKETNAEGKIKFDNLDINNKKYFIKEVKQPEGYELDSKKVEFTLSETAKQFVHRHINKKSSTPSSPSLSPTPSPSPELTPSPEPTIQEPIYEEIPESPTNEQNQAIESDEAALGENAKDTKGVEAVSSEELAAEEASNEAVSDEAEALPDLGQNNEMIRFIILLGGALIISGSWLSYRRKSYK